MNDATDSCGGNQRQRSWWVVVGFLPYYRSLHTRTRYFTLWRFQQKTGGWKTRTVDDDDDRTKIARLPHPHPAKTRAAA